MKKIFTVITISLASYGVNAQTTANKAKAPIKKTVTTATKAPAKVAVKSPVANLPKAPLFKNNLDSASYGLGLNIASSFKSSGLTTLNYEAFNKGLKDAMQNNNPSLTPEQAQQVINKLFEGFAKERAELSKKEHLPTIEAGNDFLAKNKVKPGVKTTASGLQYEVITEGTGASPKASDVVTVNYKGTLLNGEEFDSSYKRNEPSSFSLNRVITGWTEGVQLMKEGAKYRFFIPYDLAYGDRGMGIIVPFSTLVFEIELIKVGGEESQN
jgi:FKBP-type peptidyl-prolyl cis-trans isomerase FklB